MGEKTGAEQRLKRRGKKVALQTAYEQAGIDQSFCQVGSIGRFCKYDVIDPAVCRELDPRLVPRCCRACCCAGWVFVSRCSCPVLSANGSAFPSHVLNPRSPAALDNCIDSQIGQYLSLLISPLGQQFDNVVWLLVFLNRKCMGANSPIPTASSGDRTSVRQDLALVPTAAGRGRGAWAAVQVPFGRAGAAGV